MYIAPIKQIQGHRDFPKVKKACPSFDAKNEYAWILK
jgi:N-acetylmuramoyl-L-alanine amidase